MPDGTLVTDVPEGITKAQLLEKYGRYGDRKLASSVPEPGLPSLGNKPQTMGAANLLPEQQTVAYPAGPPVAQTAQPEVAQTAQTPVNEPLTREKYLADVKKREEGYTRSVSDEVINAGITFLKGAIGLNQAYLGLADIPTLGRIGKFLEEAGYNPEQAQKILDGYYSEAQQAANRRVSETKGVLPTIGALVQNPSVIAHGLGEALPQMIGGAGIARRLMKAAPGLSGLFAGAAGEGILGAGSAAEQIRGQTEDKLLTPKQSLIAVGSGLGTGAFSYAGARLAKSLGFDDFDTMLATGKSSGGAKSVLDFAKKATGSGISEGFFEEMPQSAQETMWMNYALDRPFLDGVAEAMGHGLVAGFAMGAFGGGAGALRRKPDAGITTLVPPSNSPVVNSFGKNVDGKVVVTNMRADGSVDVDGVQTVPPTLVNSLQETTPAAPIEPTGIVTPEVTETTPPVISDPAIPTSQDAQDYQKMIDELEGKPLETPAVETPVAETPAIEAVTPEVPTTPVFDSNNDLLDALETRGEQVESYQDAINRLSNGQQIFAFHDQMGDGDMPMLITSIEQLDAYTPDQLLALPPENLTPAQELAKEINEPKPETTAGPSTPVGGPKEPQATPEPVAPTKEKEQPKAEEPAAEPVAEAAPEPTPETTAEQPTEPTAEQAPESAGENVPADLPADLPAETPALPEETPVSPLGEPTPTGGPSTPTGGPSAPAGGPTPTGEITKPPEEKLPETPPEVKPPEEKPPEIKPPEKPKAEITVDTPITAQQVKARWEKDKGDRKESKQESLAGVEHVIADGTPFHYVRDPADPKKLVLKEGYSSDEAKAADDEKKKIAEAKGDPMRVAMESGNADKVAELLYGHFVESSMLPVIFPEELLLRIPVETNKVADIEAALIKFKFRITDRSIPATSNDPSYVGPERLTISALYRPGKTNIQDAGADFIGNRKMQVPPPPTPKDATDTQIKKMLAPLSPDKLFNINSNADQTLGALMYKEGLVSYIKPIAEYLREAIENIPNIGRIDKKLGNLQVIKLALEKGNQQEIQNALQFYLETAQMLQPMFDAHAKVIDLHPALIEKFTKDLGSSSVNERYTEDGIKLRKITTINRLDAIFSRLNALFGVDENSTDQSKRLVKKDAEVPPPLKQIIRRGMSDHRQGRDVDVNDFLETFGFFPGGVSFGNWVNQAERAANLNSAYDAMYDLADLSGISPKLLGLGEKLKLAIGAQGRGGKTAAHYISYAKDLAGNKTWINEINLTKTKGDGSLGHEWHHGLDFNMSNSVDGKNLMDGTVKALRVQNDPQALEDYLKSILRDTAASKENRNLPPKLAFFNNIKSNVGRPSAVIFTEKPTDFQKNAKELDESRSTPYWSTATEMLSRGFESMLFDAAKGGSPYLVGPTVADGYITKKNGYAGTTYPEGKERPILNDVFNQMLDQIDPFTLDVKKYTVIPKIIAVEGLGYAVVDQYNLNANRSNQSEEVYLRWLDSEANAKLVFDGLIDNPKQLILTPYGIQISKVNEKIISMATRIDAIMEEMNLFKWPEVKNGSMAESMFFHMGQGWWPKNNRELAEYGLKAYLQKPELLGLDSTNREDAKKLENYKLADFEGDRVKLKQTQEDFEAAATRYIGQVITDMRSQGSDTKAIYDHIVTMYQTQPTLDVQSVLSKSNSAYSTPLPIGFLVGMLARVKSTSTVLDPTGGNGMLVVSANPQKVIAIELEPHRALNLSLMQIGKVIPGDALVEMDKLRDQEVDVVLANPPFDTLPTKQLIPSWDGREYKIAKLEQLIAAKSLRAMADNGRAVLILGAHINKTITSDDRVFLNWLYGNYNVAAHFEIAGNLYRKQGATFPLRVLVIAGRNQTENVYPMNSVVDRVTTFDELWSKYVQSSDSSEKILVGTGKQQPNAGGANQQPGGVQTGGKGQTGGSGNGMGPEGGVGNGEQVPPAGGGVRTPGAGGRGTTGGVGTGEQLPSGGKTTDGGSGNGQPTGPKTGTGSGEGPNDDLGGLSDLDIDNIFDDLGEPETPKITRGPRKPGGAKAGPTGPKTAPKERKAAVIPEELKGLGLEDLLKELGDALEGKAPNPSKIGETTEDSPERTDKQANEAMNRLAQEKKDPPQQYSRKDNGVEYANVKPIIQKVWEAIGAKISDLKQKINAVYKLLSEQFGIAIKNHLRTFVDGLRQRVVKRPKNQTPVQSEPIDTESRVVYLGKSNFNNDTVYLPRAQGSDAYSALEKLEAKVGNIDEFVANELGYKSVDEMAFDPETGKSRLAGYQIDALALAIQANKEGKGFIIGDDTGVGKGRTAAAMIAWSIKNDKIPIFVTLGDALYTAMYKDLIDIGFPDFKVGMTNNASEIIKDIGEGKTDIVFKNKDGDKSGDKLMREILKTGALPQGMNVIFTAYSQLNGTSVLRQQAIASLVASGKAALIMDEAHNAAGDPPVNPEKNSLGQNEFFMTLLTGEGLLGPEKEVGEDWSPPSTVYLTATFAKRPDNMPLYIHTNLIYAAPTPEELKELFGKGVRTDVLQQVSSEMLVSSGSMLRRERSYEGVKMDYVTDEENAPRDAREVDKVTAILRSLVNADRALVEWTKTETGTNALLTLAPAGSTVGEGRGDTFKDAQKGTFTSVVHNYISSLLVATKAKTTVQMVIDKMNAGEKVVIGLQNTGGAALEDYTKTNNIKPGQDLTNFGWQTIIKRAVDSTTRVTFRSSTGNKKDNVRVQIPYDLMPPAVKAGYINVAKLIENFNSELTVSPIDYIRSELEKLYVWTDPEGRVQVVKTPPDGVKSRRLVVKEITGRKVGVNFNTDIPQLINLNSPSKSEAISSFQNGDESEFGPIDVLIINAAGATGISLHASTEAFDQRPRQMIVMQPHADISIFIQLLGRIHRTGQVEWPSFTMLATGIPAERRILAMLRKKLSSLKSNTSGGSSSTKVETVDFINMYGDVVTAEYLNEHADIRTFLGQKTFQDPDKAAGTDLAMKASGTAALLSVEDQQEYFDSIEAGYRAAIELRNATGTNALERRILPLNAVLQEETLIEEGLDENNPFLADVAMGKFEVDVIGTIPTQKNIEDDIEESLRGRSASAVIDQIESDLTEIYTESRNQIILKQQTFNAALADPAATEKDRAELTRQKEALDIDFAKLGERKEKTLRTLRSDFAIGYGYETFEVANVPASAVIIGIKVDMTRIGKSKTGNPYSPSNFQIIFKRNIPDGRVAPTLATLEGESIKYEGLRKNPPLDRYFALKSVTGGRTNRYIALGNILRAAQLFQSDGGEIVKFTIKDKLEPVSGVIMPAKYKPIAASAQPVRLRNANAAVQYFLARWLGLLEYKFIGTDLEEYSNAQDKIKPLMLPNLPKSFSLIEERDKSGIDQILRKNAMLTGARGMWILSVDYYKPTRFKLAIHSDVNKKFLKNPVIQSIAPSLAKKRNEVYYEMDSDSHITDPDKLITLIKTLHKAYPASAQADFGAFAREVMKVEFDDSESKRGAKSRAVAEGGQSVEAVQSQIIPIKGITVRVVQSAEELPEDAAPSDVEGAWYSGRTVWMVADNLPNAKRVQEVLAHEAIGHAAMEDMLGPELMVDLIKGVQKLEQTSPAVQRAAAIVDRSQPDLSPGKRAKEIIAVMAEKGMHKNNQLLQRIIQAVRTWLRGLGFTIKFSDRDVLAMLRNAEEYISKEQNVPQFMETLTNEDPLYSRKNTFGGNPPVSTWTSLDPSTYMKDLEYRFGDKYVDVKDVQKAVENVIGTIDDQYNAYQKETIYHGRTSKQVKDFLNSELMPIIKRMKALNVDLPSLEKYLHNRHAEERNIQIAKVNPLVYPDGGSGIDTAVAQA